MPKFLRFQQKNLADLATRVAAGLVIGPAVVPMLGGYCVVSRARDQLTQFGSPGRLVSGPDELQAELAGIELSYRERVVRAMTRPLVGRFGAGQDGVAVAADPFVSEILRRAAGEVWFGVPEDGTGPGELVEQLVRPASVVVTGPAAGPGPTGVVFGARPAVVDRRGKLAILDLEYELGELVRLDPSLFFSVLVVCTGNSCRSPMAQVMLARMLEGTPAFVYSAGTAAPVGSPATALAVAAMSEVGLDLTRNRARQLEPEMIRAADLVLVMEDYHRQRVLETVPEAAGRTRLLLSFAGSESEVGDPLGSPLVVYRRTREQMRTPLERVAREVRYRAGRDELPAAKT